MERDGRVGRECPLSKCTDAGTRSRGLFLTLDVVAPSVAEADPGPGWGSDWLLPLDLRLLQGSCGVFWGRHSRPVAVTGGRCKGSRVVLCFFLQSAVRLFGLTLLQLKQDCVSLPEPLT